MNTYTYEEIFIGQEEKFSFEITKQQMSMFREITGDHNPLHTDIKYAKLKGYPNNVVYGMLTASYLSALAGMYLPGKNSLIHEVELKFTKPCYPDSGKFTAVGICTDKQDLFNRITIKVRIKDQEDELVLRGIMKIGVTDDNG